MWGIARDYIKAGGDCFFQKVSRLLSGSPHKLVEHKVLCYSTFLYVQVFIFLDICIELFTLFPMVILLSLSLEYWESYRGAKKVGGDLWG